MVPVKRVSMPGLTINLQNVYSFFNTVNRQKVLIKVSQISLFQLIFTDFVPCEQRPFNLPRGSWLRMAKLENSVPIFSKTHFHFLKTQLAFLISENISKCKSESPRQPPRHQVKIILYKNQYFFISWTDFLVNNRQPSNALKFNRQPW